MENTTVLAEGTIARVARELDARHSIGHSIPAGQRVKITQVREWEHRYEIAYQMPRGAWVRVLVGYKDVQP